MLATPIVFAVLLLGFAAPYRLLRGWWKDLPATLLRLHLEALAEVWEQYVDLLDGLIYDLKPAA